MIFFLMQKKQVEGSDLSWRIPPEYECLREKSENFNIICWHGYTTHKYFYNLIKMINCD